MSATERQLTKKGEKRRQELLDAALELFGSTGYHATTIDQIAAAADTGKGTVYWYWKSKEEIFAELVRLKFEAYTDALNRAVAMPVSAPEKLLLLLTEVSRLMEKYRQFCKLIFMVLADRRDRFGEDIHQSVNRYYEQFHGIIRDIVQQGQSEGQPAAPGRRRCRGHPYDRGDRRYYYAGSPQRRSPVHGASGGNPAGHLPAGIVSAIIN